MRIVYAVVCVFLLRNILYLQLQLSYSLKSFSSPALIIKISNLYSPFSLFDSNFFLLPDLALFQGGFRKLWKLKNKEHITNSGSNTDNMTQLSS